MGAPCISTTLASGINQSCVNQTVGFEKNIILIAKSKLDVPIGYSEANIINQITLTAPGYKCGALNADSPFKDAKIEGKKGDYVVLYDGTLPIFIAGDSPENAKIVSQLANDKYIAIFTRIGYDPAKKNKYVVMGAERGLSFATANFSNATQNEFGWKVELKEMEALTGVSYLWATNESTTDTLFEGLLS